MAGPVNMHVNEVIFSNDVLSFNYLLQDRKLKPYSTPFDVRLDRALKNYSA